ncbi:4'-phosphopantetheinyl transferase superfamily protein [Oscillatoriales cyanobacterium LEGE 11467]|uniref:4'-phosphopantetheinyl transferase superfamily protein n=1 Tax=Zarconia navalis LEGE 11467 TaxID=1828826 RepID=A0A928W217_9CYAN|nr:4'-phosphopantetheinyl transferase superfamily protein [Zarconia navalis]MBE9042478.1 4'-phosphopantetheinyl transferase superfamily protein [Zarconia navalis LEGE 11467]
MTVARRWLSPPPVLNLSSDLIHVWRADLDSQPIELLLALLSADERQRADRFFRQVDRHSFIAARGILRKLLGSYLNRPPERLEFGYAERGKPFLVDGVRAASVRENCNNSLEFNLSHSGGIALYAIARHRRVGIDVESFRELDTLPLAQRFFSDREYRQLSGYPPERQPAAFFSAWTAKEALLKATGEGLLGLSQVEISLAGEDLIPSLHSMASSPAQWYLQSLEVGAGYKAAVAIEGEPCLLDCYGFE